MSESNDVVRVLGVDRPSQNSVGCLGAQIYFDMCIRPHKDSLATQLDVCTVCRPIGIYKLILGLYIVTSPVGDQTL